MNADAPMIIGEAVRFCPGVVGGAEWNSPAYDPSTNLVLTGQVDWCYSVTLEDENKLRDSPEGQPWMGSQSLNPLYALGTPLEGTRNGTAGSMP